MTRLVALGATLIVLTVAVPAQAATPFGTTPCPGVRPGAPMEAPASISYTIGFLLKGKDAKGKTANYITTVGNFVFTTFGTKTWKPGTGPDARDGGGKKFGRFVWAAHTDMPAYTSFGLILVDPKVKVSGQVCHFGGPTGLYEGTGVAPVVIEYYGNGAAAQTISPARSALATGTDNATNAVSQGLWAPGDDGAPVLAGGAALGYYDGGVGGGSNGAGFVVSRLDQWIARAGKALKVKLTLVTGGTL
ncbi:MAG: hypothetical protein ACRDKJ_14280 [Actinomycetota bacterium]